MTVLDKGSSGPDSSKIDEKIKKRKNTRWSRFKTYQKVLIILFSCIFFIAACGAGFFYFYLKNASKIINSGTSTEIENVLIPVETPQDPVTILFLGRDTRDSENDKGRADTIMLLHINPAEKRASVLSIPRDTLVEIPGHGQDKINAAYALGGEELMIKTVSSFLDAVINHYVTIDFEGFVKLIDELGGVDVTIDRPIEDPKTGAYISAGNHHFTGEQALAFTRSRSTELGDIARIQRQQYIFKQLVSQKLNLQNISSINSYFNIIVENTRTDIELMTIIAYAKAALSFGMDNISSAIIPTHSEWIEEGTKSVQIPDTAEAQAMWQRVIFGQPLSKYGLEYTGGAENIPESMGKNRIYFCRIRVKNTGIVTWERGGSEPFYMSYHWLDFETKKTEVFDGERTLLPVDRIEPGQETEMDLKILAPQEPGSYILQVDMVHEGKTWFSYQGVPALEKYVSVNVDYAASYSDDGTTPNQVQPGEKFTTYITVTNNGFLNWENKGPQRVDLGVHWYNRDTREVEIFDADSGELPGNVGHGESAQVAMQITAPQKPGRYVLAYDLVHEQVTWFSHQGVFPLEIDVNVGMTLDNSIVKKTSVMVYNGCGIKGAATEFSDYLKSFNFKVYGMANAKNYDFEKTYVIYKSGKEKNAEQLGLILSNYVLEKYSTKWADYYSKADMIVILGRDYKSNIEKP